MVPSAQHYLKDPVKGPEATTLGWPIRAHSVDIDTLLQEAIRDAKTKVIPQGVLVQGHLGAEGRGIPWRSDLCPSFPQQPKSLGVEPTPSPQPSCAPCCCPWQHTLRFPAPVTVGNLGKGFLLSSSSVLSFPSGECLRGVLTGFHPSNTCSSLKFTKKL